MSKESSTSSEQCGGREAKAENREVRDPVQKPPRDTRKGDRHRPGYWVEYGRKRRAKEREAKASKPVKTNRQSAN